MVDERENEDRQKTRAAFLASLRKSREQATEEVNWLLIIDSRHMREEFSKAKLETETWADSAVRRLAELDDEPSTNYEIESARDGLNASLNAAKAAGSRSRAKFNERRALFAEMLAEVRASRKVLFSADAIGEIRMLNADGYLAQMLDLDNERFDSYYGGHQAVVPAVSQGQPVLAAQPALRSPVPTGIDYSRRGSTLVPKVELLHDQARVPKRQGVGVKQPVELPPEPDRDLEPGLDF